MAVNAAARLWSPYKDLCYTVESALQQRAPDSTHDLETVLRRHKPDFISLLKNPARNAGHRETVRKAHKDGVPFHGQPGNQVLSESLIGEALTLSDLFDVNEFAAIELLLTGESQQPFFPGLPRGLVAVTLYYDGQWSMVTALSALLQARQGSTWSLNLPEDLGSLVTKFTDQLIADSILVRIIELLSQFSAIGEIEKLQKPEFRALGAGRHHKEVTEKIQAISQLLADCVFNLACQSSLSRSDVLRLVSYLREHGASRADGGLDGVTTAILLALLYGIQADREALADVDDLAQHPLPLLNDPAFAQDLHHELETVRRWNQPGVLATIQFAWALTLRNLSQFPGQPVSADLLEQDEQLLELAVNNDVFHFLNNAVLTLPRLQKEEHYIRQLHHLLTDFIVLMPLKVKELRNRGDETARIVLANQQEGLEPPPNLRRDFEHLLRLMGSLYGKDPLGLELAAEYWCPPDPSGPNVTHTSLYNYRPPQKQISLFKYVRLAGDLLSPPLFIPYIEMLTGLATGPQCAHHCFNLLRSNGTSGGAGQVSTVSWDHFFISLNNYYTNLRQETPMTSDLAHIYHHHPRGITPQEVEGIVAILKLLQRIATEDESSRIALCENQQWLPLPVLVGFVGCSIPLQLKAEILRTLASLAHTAEIAANLWQLLEVSQIIPTVNSASIHKKGGLLTELEEVEASFEEFPITRAFLELINELTNNPIPAGLGVGYRAPGFQPYLDFLVGSVLLKFNTRAYKNVAEKWQVATLVLEILHKLLADYTPVAEDFVDHQVELQGEGATVAHKPPGYVLMVHLLSDSPTLKLLLAILDECAKQLDKYVAFPGQEDLERAGLWCLRLVQTALSQQTVFLDALREGHSAIIVARLDQLLLGINPRTSKADHLVNVTKFVTYNTWLVEHSLTAVQILGHVCHTASVHPKLVGLFTATQELSSSLLHGFVECMDNNDFTEDQDDNDLSDSELTRAQVWCRTRQNIVRLLLQCIELPAPNLAHFLLGFNLTKSVSSTNLEDPGVRGCRRTCLHSILGILTHGLDSRPGPSCCYTTPRLAELSFHLFYALGAHPETSAASLRYLRTHDFLYKQLQNVPFTQPDEAGGGGNESVVLGQQAWLLKAAALELRVTALNRQRSNTQRLLNLLLDDTPATHSSGYPGDGGAEPDYSQYEMDYTAFSSSQLHLQQAMGGSQTRRKILSVLDAIDFSQDNPPALELEFLNPAGVEQIFAACQKPSDLGVTLTDIAYLHRVLYNDLNNLQGAVTGQRPLIQNEIQLVCRSAVERNTYQQVLQSKRSAFDAWRQLVEVILTACPEDLLQGEPRQSLIFELLQDLLAKVSKEDVIAELTIPVSGVILTLMANLCQCFLMQPADSAGSDAVSHYVPLLESGATSSMQAAVFDQGGGSRTLFASSLQVVLKGLIEHLMRSTSGSQRVRAYLYGALLYFLQIAKVPKLSGSTTGGVARKIVAKETEYERLTRENVAVIASYGENFCEVVCRDACDGHGVGRMLALGSLDVMLSVEHSGGGGAWLSHLTSRGYLQHIVDSLVQDNTQLQGLLQATPAPLKPLYIHESKIGLLTRLGETAVGAHSLLQCGLPARLAECSILDCRPDTQSIANEGFLPSALARFRRQIFFPVLKLCLAILTSMGIENQQASAQMLKVVLGHVDVFSAVLRAGVADAGSLEDAQELALVTAIISRAAIHDCLDDLLLGDSSTLEARGLQTRLQRQMLTLLPKYCPAGRPPKLRLGGTGGGPQGGVGVEGEGMLQLAREEVASNVTAFCRALISKSGKSSQFFRILFSPSLEGVSRDYRHMNDVTTSLGNPSQPQPLGVVVQMLQQSAAHFLACFEHHATLTHKLGHLSDLNTDELKELCDTSQCGEKLSSQQKQRLAWRRLQTLASHKAQQLEHFSYIIENCLFILWRHLEFYLVHCVPAEIGTSLYRLNVEKQEMRRLQDSSVASRASDLAAVDETGLYGGVSVGVTREELQRLKLDAVVYINDTLLKKLHEMEQCYTRSRSRYSFVEALVRRLKRLLRLQTGVS